MNKTYYYAKPGNQPQGPFDENDLRNLLSKGEINEQTNVIEKGQAQWSKIRDLFPSAQESDFPLPPHPSYQDRYASTPPRKTLHENCEQVFLQVSALNILIDKLLYKVFGHEKYVPKFKNFVSFTCNITSVLTIISTILCAFVMVETTMKTEMTGGLFIGTLVGGFLSGVFFQYIVNLFSRVNISYIFGPSPAMSSMLIPKLFSISLIFAAIGLLIMIFISSSYMILILIFAFISVLYMIWLHLNSDKIFMQIDESTARGSWDLISYFGYIIRYTLVSVQTLTPIWLSMYIVLSIVLLVNERTPQEIKFIGNPAICLPGCLIPVIINFIYMILSIIPDFVSRMLGKRR